MRYCIILFLTIIVELLCAQGVRKYSNEFLKIGVGGKYLGLGSSLATADGDPSCVFYNPSAMSTLDGISISAMHNSYFAGIANFDYGGVVVPLGENQHIGFSVVRLGIDNIPNTIQLYNPDGSINYDNISSFGISDMAGYVSYSRKLSDNLSLGANVKVIKRDYGTFANAWGFGIDAGVQYSKENMKLGAFLQDITTTFSTWSFSFTEKEKAILASTGNEIPISSSEITLPAIHLGGQYTFLYNQDKISLTPSAKATVYTDKRNVLISDPIGIDIAMGAELGLWKIAFIRLGVGNFTKSVNPLGETYTSVTPSLGAGFKLDQFEIDYSYNNVANTGVGLYSHVFSACYKFKPKSKYTEPIRVPNSQKEELDLPDSRETIPIPSK